MVSKFETIGANRLSLCDNLNELNKTFAHSFDVCVTKDRCNECRYCASILADKTVDNSKH